MERATKKFLSTALFVPVLSLTAMQAPMAWSQTQQNPNFIERVLGSNKNQTQYVAQASTEVDTRTIQLEQALRDLTTQVENLNFQVLQMQNRIDVLEGKAPSNAAIAQSQQRQQAPNTQATSTNIGTAVSGQSGVTPNTPPRSAPANSTPNRTTNSDGYPAAPSPARSNTQSSATPNGATNNSSESLGSIHFDRDGNIIENNNDKSSQAGVPAGGNQTSSVPQASSAKELYQIGYQSILAGDYRAAEPIFRAFQERYPSDPLIADASFWLGESLYGQGRYREAAQAYMDVERNYATAPRAPENMLKLGMTMAELNDDETACAVFAKVPQQYQQAEPAVLKRVSDEQQRLNCSQ